MSKKDIVYIRFSENYFEKNDIVSSTDCLLKVISVPNIKWKKILRFITFNLYKLSPYYKLKILK